MSLFQTTRNKARYGHRNWILWTNKAGEEVAAPVTPTSMKQCLLEVGTQGKWFFFSANCGTPTKGFWWLGLNLLAQSKRKH